jgi:hypothetical protein
MTQIQKEAEQLYPIASDHNKKLQQLRQISYTLGATRNAWVSVDDELPPINTEVLTYSFSVGYLVDIVPFAYMPTHWQPLPNKPL